jgi:toxin-antitoxin system PIN domain toxin
LTFPDVNVWLALTFERHVHHRTAAQWFTRLGDGDRICFCRFTQIGFLRLLSTKAVMGEQAVKSQSDAWKEYDKWRKDGRVRFVDEPADLEPRFRLYSQSSHPSRRDWADAYLAAFASTMGMCLVTFDRGFHDRLGDVIVLET